MKKTYLFTIKDELSIYYPSKIIYDNKEFINAFHLILYLKALLFNDKRTAQYIQKESNINILKIYTKQIKNYQHKTYLKHSLDISKTVLKEKFNQHTNIYNKALNLYKSGYKFVYANRMEFFWSTGLIENSVDNYDETKWKGKNRLGKLIEEIIKENINNK